MSDDEGNLEVVELSGAVIRSFYKDIPMFVFRANGAEPTMSRAVAFVMLLSLVAARLERMLILLGEMLLDRRK